MNARSVVPFKPPQRPVVRIFEAWTDLLHDAIQIEVAVF